MFEGHALYITPHIEPIEHELATFSLFPIDSNINICTTACDRGVNKLPKT